MPGPNQMDEDTYAQTFSAAIAPVAGSAGGAYTATEQGIINALVTAVNQLNAALKQAGITQQD